MGEVVPRVRKFLYALAEYLPFEDAFS